MNKSTFEACTYSDAQKVTNASGDMTAYTKGAAFQLRITATPGGGPLTGYQAPEGLGIRVDSGIGLYPLLWCEAERGLNLHRLHALLEAPS